MNGFPDTQVSQAGMGNQFSKEATTAGLPWKLMTFAIVFFIFAIFVYAGLRYGYEGYLNKRDVTAQTETNLLAKKIIPKEQNDFINFYSQVKNMNRVLAAHSYSTNVFKFLETKTVKDVYYKSAKYSKENFRVDLEGYAVSTAALVQQLAAFDGATADISESVLTQMGYDEAGRLTFGIRIKFKSDSMAQPK
ncbi:MAG: hypothetical protein NTZ36_02240 [Candidatus Jorgensenbacteria bacterium]|nr:hypothetical protein [Candidatus Jorgensenbacteria bacterium]